MSSKQTSTVPVIEPSENGPYMVKHLTSLINSKGESIQTKETIALCRCGGSANKPFCDGTHTKIGFSSEKQSDGSMNKRDNYVGKQTKITIHDNRGICAHAGKCTDGLPSVWRMRVEPWIDADAADIDAIIDTIRLCPSGALSYSIDAVEHRNQKREPVITVSKDGPYHVAGCIKLNNAVWGEGASTEHYTLCRCGASKNKPFCDGSHWHVKFQDEKN